MTQISIFAGSLAYYVLGAATWFCDPSALGSRASPKTPSGGFAALSRMIPSQIKWTFSN
jgi:hypothetical protein